MAELEADGLVHRTDYYEFGVFRGYALHTAQVAARELARRLDALLRLRFVQRTA